MFIYTLVIPVLVYVIGSYIDRRYHMYGNKLLLITASLLFSASLFLPSPIINGIDTEFWAHFFGGGVFIGLLCVYFRPLLKRELEWYQELMLLFIFVSTFGVINELYELFSSEIGIYDELLDDTSWDLLANSLGALVFFLLYKGINRLKTLFISR